MSNATPFPLNAFSSLGDGQPIACLQGELVKLYPAKSGKNSVGPWSLQNGELQADGVTIPITFKDRDELDQTWKGRVILLTASNDKGMKGLYCWDDEKNNVKVRKIKVTPSASLDIIDTSAGRGSAAAQQPHQQGQQQQRDPDGPTGNAHDNHGHQQQPNQGGGQGGDPQRKQRSKEEEDFLDARRTIQQLTNLHLLCLLAVERYEAPAFKSLTGRDMPEGQRQAAASSLFIKADKLGLDRFMPLVDATKDPRFKA